MLTIRFARTGKKHQAYFRIVVADKRKSVSAKFIEILGNYDPHAKKLSIDKEKLAAYLKNGAVPSNTVAKLLKLEKIELPKWVRITEKKKASKKKEEPKAAEKKDEVKEETEAPAEESPKEDKGEEPANSETPKEEGAEDNKENNPEGENEAPAVEGAKEGE